MRLFLFTLLLLSPFLSNAQGSKLELKHVNAIVFYDYLDHCFYALDDSTFIWKFDSKENEWKKAPVNLVLEISFEEFLKDFIPLSDKGCPTYFVHSGCGLVYQKLNNRIYRHDKSFKHMNQFGGSFFMDEGEPRIFGGYGLFTLKNIITRYDTVSREWYELPAKGTRPDPMLHANIWKGKRAYYLVGGFLMHNDTFYPNKKIWRFSKNTLKWEVIGGISKILDEKKLFMLNNNSSFRISAPVLCTSHYWLSLNVKNEMAQIYNVKSEANYNRIVFGEHSLCFLMMNTIKQRLSLNISSQDVLANFPSKKLKFTSDTNASSFSVLELTFLFLGVFLISLIIFYWVKRRKSSIDTEPNAAHPLTADYQNDFPEYTLQEELFLKGLLEKKSTGIEISEINDFVNHDSPSIDTLKKRRELLLKELKFKLSKQYSLAVDQVIIEKRMDTDKRMKLLFLNEEIVDFLERNSR